MHIHHLLSEWVWVLPDVTTAKVVVGEARDWLGKPLHDSFLSLLAIVLAAGTYFQGYQTLTRAKATEVAMKNMRDQLEKSSLPHLQCSDVKGIHHEYTCKFKNTGQSAATAIQVRVGEGYMELERDRLAPGESTVGHYEHAGGPTVFTVVYSTPYGSTVTARVHSDGYEEEPQIDRTKTVYPVP